MCFDWIDWGLLRIYGFIVIGIIISIIIPILRTLLPKSNRETLAATLRGGDETKKLKFGAVAFEAAKPYFYLAIFSIVTAVIVLAYLSSSATTTTIAWSNAVIYGFTWDSVLQKAVGPKDVGS
jgi:hypothetical protein